MHMGHGVVTGKAYNNTTIVIPTMYNTCGINLVHLILTTNLQIAIVPAHISNCVNCGVGHSRIPHLNLIEIT